MRKTITLPANLALRNIQHAEFASEETNCFTATVYIDGKRAGTVDNDGHGGCNNYHPHDLEARLTAIAKAQPQFYPAEAEGETGLDNDADLLIDLLFEQAQAAKQLDRLFKRNVLVLRDGKIYAVKPGNPAALPAWLRDPLIATKLKAEKVLNLLPRAEALSLFIAHG